MDAKIRITYCDENGNEILEPVEGQKAFSPETKKLYTFHDGAWEMVTGDVNVGMTMYDLNKQIISQMPILDEGALDIARSKIVDYLIQTGCEYYMMLCRELNYYTVFQVVLNHSSLPHAMNEVIACADYLGDIKSIEWEEDKGAIEIWITERENDKETYVIYLFPYDAGVITCTL